MTLSDEAIKARRKYKREYYKKNRERINDYQRNWRKENADKIQEYNRNYWERVAQGKNEADTDE